MAEPSWQDLIFHGRNLLLSNDLLASSFVARSGYYLLCLPNYNDDDNTETVGYNTKEAQRQLDTTKEAMMRWKIKGYFADLFSL